MEGRVFQEDTLKDKTSFLLRDSVQNSLGLDSGGSSGGF